MSTTVFWNHKVNPERALNSKWKIRTCAFETVSIVPYSGIILFFAVCLSTNFYDLLFWTIELLVVIGYIPGWYYNLLNLNCSYTLWTYHCSYVCIWEWKWKLSSKYKKMKYQTLWKVGEPKALLENKKSDPLRTSNWVISQWLCSQV